MIPDIVINSRTSMETMIEIIFINLFGSMHAIWIKYSSILQKVWKDLCWERHYSLIKNVSHKEALTDIRNLNI